MNEITITRVANGWLVVLPRPENVYYSPGGIIPDQYNTLVAAGRAIRDGGDDVMDKIKRDQQEPEDQPDTLQIKKQDNIHCFVTFAEVLSFLKFKIVE